MKFRDHFGRWRGKLKDGSAAKKKQGEGRAIKGKRIWESRKEDEKAGRSKRVRKVELSHDRTWAAVNRSESPQNKLGKKHNWKGVWDAAKHKPTQEHTNTERKKRKMEDQVGKKTWEKTQMTGLKINGKENWSGETIPRQFLRCKKDRVQPKAGRGPKHFRGQREYLGRGKEKNNKIRVVAEATEEKGKSLAKRTN